MPVAGEGVKRGNGGFHVAGRAPAGIRRCSRQVWSNDKDKRHQSPDKSNGLTKVSAVDALQLRGVDVHRLTQRMGRLSAAHIEEITADPFSLSLG